MVNTNSVLSSILFSQTIDWNIKQFFSSTSINSSFELFAEQFGVIAVHLPKYILGQFFGKLCHIMIAIPSSWCGIELGVNGSLLKVRPNILFLNFIAPSFLARSLAGHLAAFE